MGRPKRYTPWADKVFKSGPTIPLLDAKRYRVKYRTRPRGLVGWKEWTMEMVTRTPEECRRRVIRTVARRDMEVEVMRVEEISAEQPIQTGRTVKTVSEKSYLEGLEEAKEKTEYERKELLRAKGLWLP